MPRAPRAAEGGMVHPVLNRGNARASGPFSRPHAAGDLEIWRDVAFVGHALIAKGLFIQRSRVKL